jgi:hypothetical protein
VFLGSCGIWVVISLDVVAAGGGGWKKKGRDLRRTKRRTQKKKKKKKKKKLIIMASYPPGRQNPGGQNPAWGRRPTQPFAMAHQPAAGRNQLPPPNSGTWTTGLCGCSRDINSCKT